MTDMRTQLYSHNRTAYQKVMKAFEASNRTCVVHPTGTGKSYLIAAVSESYKKVLILGPNDFVLDQVRDVLKWRKEGIEYMTYQLLMFTENLPTGYDLIVLDEFHRAGAPEWGDTVDRLLEANQQAKVLGTTATPIRYLDDNRDMADELFGGNIASQMSIAEAWNQNILPIPRYVSGLFRWDKTIADATDRINRSRSLTDENKRERIFRLTNTHLHWELSYGMPAILRKHLGRDAHRIIVFCGNIGSLEGMREEVVGWFREAGFTVCGTYLLHSNLTDSEQREQMNLFEDEIVGGGVKLMFSVNMLNEGIHVPNVNAVLMLRTTASRIIYMQQMGRCLTAANTAKPLVLDMVDNITTTTAIKDLQDEFDAIEIQQADREGREPRRFEVNDYTLGVKDLIDKLAPIKIDNIPIDERIAMLAFFCEEHNRFPSSRDKNERRDFLNLVTLKEHNSEDDRFRELIVKYAKWRTFEYRLARLSKFIEENDRLPYSNQPKGSKEYDEYANYRILVAKHRRKHDDRFQEILDKWRHQVGNDELLQQLRDFVATHGRFPSTHSKQSFEERSLGRKVNLYLGEYPLVKALKEKYVRSRTSLEDKICVIEKFVAEHGRRPLVSEKKMYRIWNRMNESRKSNPRVQELFAEYGMSQMKHERYSQEEKVLMMKDFTAKHGRKPLRSEGRMYRIWARMAHLGKSDPRVKEMVEKYGTARIDNKETLT